MCIRDSSLHEMNASANRGACMQICRRAYDVKDKESAIELEVDNQYIMSTKDLKTIHFMDEMIEAGVRVLDVYKRQGIWQMVKDLHLCVDGIILYRTGFQIIHLLPALICSCCVVYTSRCV